MPDNNADRRLAVLIDADNASRTAMSAVMAEIAVYGTPTVKRIYGDWTTPNLASWKTILLENAITPIQQYSYTTGKNATDSAMIIDAMDLLYNTQCDGFVLVSSDSDFTRLAIRLREAGKLVIGMGERKTPAPFIVACDKFIYIEVIRAHQAEEEAAVTEVNTGVYLFRVQPLLEALGHLKNDNAQGEYYLTDVPGYLLSQGGKVGVCDTCSVQEMLGVNTPAQLQEVEDILSAQD